MHKKTDYFNNLGDDFEIFMCDYDVARRMELMFTQLLNKINFSGKSILEVGCGTGRVSKRIFDLGASLTVLDIGENLVQEVSGRLGCVGIVGDACNLPSEDNQYDLVISSECIEHTNDPLKAIKQMCRVCKPGGQVCLTTPNKLWYPVLYLSEIFKMRKYSGIENWIFPFQAAKVMRKEGMNDIRFSGCHLWPFQLRYTRFLLQMFDKAGFWLYPFMINFGVTGTK